MPKTVINLSCFVLSSFTVKHYFFLSLAFNFQAFLLSLCAGGAWCHVLAFVGFWHQMQSTFHHQLPLCVTLLLLSLIHLFRRMLQWKLPGSLPFSLFLSNQQTQFPSLTSKLKTLSGSGSLFSCYRLWARPILWQLPCFGKETTCVHQRPSHPPYINSKLQP